MIDDMSRPSRGSGFLGLAVLIVIALLAIALVAWALPQYNVYKSEKAGQAELAQADYNRQIAVVEAEAKLAAAESLAKAEVKRAEGVAKANMIIGDSLKGNTAYLDYLWLTEKITASNKEVIYVPTEAQLPILEATRNQG